MFAVKAHLASAPPQTRPQQLNRGSHRLGAAHVSRLRLRAEKEDAERESEPTTSPLVLLPVALL
jgi:hypothetical protein